MVKRRRVQHTLSFVERIAEQTKKVRAKAQSLPDYQRRDGVVASKLKQIETAERISQWLSSGEQDVEPSEELTYETETP